MIDNHDRENENPEAEVVDSHMLETPPDEEESPERVIGLSKKGQMVSFQFARPPSQQKLPNPLEPKESTAYELTRLCIIVVAAIWLLDVIITPESAITTQVVDLLKYVITASLGFFFGSTKNSNNNNPQKK